MGSTTKAITYEDSLRLPFNPLEEIIDGAPFIMPPASDRHYALIECLADLLKSQLSRNSFRVVAGGVGLGIRRDGPQGLLYRIPDLMVLGVETLARSREQKAPEDPYIWAVPEFVAECLSPANRKGSVARLLSDYGQKAFGKFGSSNLNLE